MAKKAKSGINFKQLLLEKGERYGFYAAGGLLLLFLFLGVFKAATSASTGSIVKEFETKIQTVNKKIDEPGQQPKPIDPVVYDTSTVANIPFTVYPVRNELWNVAVNEQTKRLNPHLYPPTEAQVDFVRGSINVYDIIVGPDGKRMISVITEHAKLQNIVPKLTKRIKQGVAIGQQPGANNGPPGRSGRPGGPGMPGGPGAQNTKSTETAIETMPIDDPKIDQANFALALDPRRMVVVTASVPFKAQVEEYRRALRAKSAGELSEYPEYRGFVVERRMLALDGQTVEQDWTLLDIPGTLGDLFSRVIEFEPENPPREMPQNMQALYPRIVPDESNELLVPRPKLYRGEYPPINLPSVTDALKKLADSGQGVVEVRTQTQKQLEDNNIFNRGNADRQQGAGGAGGPPRMGGAQGGGLRPGMRVAAPPPDARPGVNNQPQRVDDEDAWIMRFIDVTTEAGHAYQYRVSLKALNPNFHKPPKELAMPSLADKEMLQSEPYEIPKLVIVPPEEYLFAATKDDSRNGRATERMPPPGQWDKTWLQMHRWYAFIQAVEFSRAEPFGEWLVADIQAVRGQFVGETMPVRLPVWFMAKGMFLFRDNPRRARAAGGVIAGLQPRSEPTWTLQLAPAPQVLLVDFEGGQGKYVGPKNKLVDDAAGVEMLFLTADGNLKVARSGRDLNDADRVQREDGWNAWLKRVADDTSADKNRGDGTGPGGSDNTPRGR
jgi:hypothetical protein